MKKLVVLLLILCIGMVANAQNKTLGELPINISYFGESGVHPGLKVGVEYPLWQKDKYKKRFFKKREKKIGSKGKRKELYGAGNLAFYNHANNHSGLLLGGELGWRRTKLRKGQTLGASLGLGYLQRFYNIDTYQLGSGSTPDQLGLSGRSIVFTSLSVSMGRDLSIRKNIPMTWHIKPTLLFQMPYNHTVVPTAALELGITYKFGS